MSNIIKGKEVAELLKEIVRRLKESGEVKVFGLGKFVVKQMKERQGFNPKTGKKITIPARKKVVLRIGKKFKDAVHAARL